VGAVPPEPIKFEGTCKAIKGRVYDYSDRMQADQFARMTKGISVYVGNTYKYDMDISTAIDELEISVPNRIIYPRGRPPKTNPSTARK
jgi:hypothetical protein